MENLEQEKISKVKSKFEKEHTKISVFLRFDQIEYLNKEHVEPNCSNMSLVVRNAVDIFIEKEKLQVAGVKYPIKLEYYKIINEDEFINKNNAKYGIKVVKTEYIENNTKTEEKTLKYLSSNEQKVNEILKVLEKNEVTPIGLEDVICDFSKEILFL